MKTLVLGLGNPLLSDDGVGWQVAEQLRLRVTNPEVEVDCLAGGGLSLMERLIGYDRVLLVDAMASGRGVPGQVSCVDLEQLPDLTAGHISSPHDTSLKNALQLGRDLGLALPDEVRVIAVEASSVDVFSETLTPPVAAAVPVAVQCALDTGWL